MFESVYVCVCVFMCVPNLWLCPRTWQIPARARECVCKCVCEGECVRVCVCVCVCVCVRERERERESVCVCVCACMCLRVCARVFECVYVCACVNVFACVWERECERERGRERERARAHARIWVFSFLSSCLRTRGRKIVSVFILIILLKDKRGRRLCAYVCVWVGVRIFLFECCVLVVCMYYIRWRLLVCKSVCAGVYTPANSWAVSNNRQLTIISFFCALTHLTKPLRVPFQPIWQTRRN